MPSTYDGLGIRFQYPDNWTLDEQEAIEGNNSVSVYSPGGAFWTVTLHPADASSPAQLAETVLATMRQMYQDLDAEEAEETVSGESLIGYDINFYCLDLTNTAIVRAFQRGETSYLLLCQADDREFDQIEPVFQAITRSLLS